MFRSAQGALRWAYEQRSRPLVKLSGINDMRGSGGGTCNELLIGLTPSECHEQAEHIVNYANSLPDKSASQYLGAKYGGESEPRHVRALMYHVIAMLGTGAHNRRAVYLILKMYLGARVSQGEVRKVLACSNVRAIQVRLQVFDVLDTVHCRAMACISECLEERGLIARAAA